MEKRFKYVALVLLLVTLISACTGNGASEASDDDGMSQASSGSNEVVFLDGSFIHEISVEFDEDAYQAMLASYAANGEKEWIEATVTIDGMTYENVGIRLKGNSSLRGLTRGGLGGGATDPEDLPWLIRLDKYVDGQNHNGIFDFVVRSNTTVSALNEALALELLEIAGLASQDSAYASFTVNGSDAVLRLVMEHPDDVWLEDAFVTTGILYKAESTGNYDYRGTDFDAYDEVFDIEAGEGNGDLTPLIEFLDFINNADDETFNTELTEHLDVDAFATYLAAQDLIANFDDIDGPGNNSYLFYDIGSGIFTIVPWDHNLAFGVINRAGDDFGQGNAGPDAGAGQPRRTDQGEDFIPPQDGDFTPPQDGDFTPPQNGDFTPPQGGPDGARPGGGGFRPGGGSNVLVERFLANPEWQSLYDEKKAELERELYDSGAAQSILDRWVSLLTDEGADLIDLATVDEEASAIKALFP